jgi:hypothetical protein
VTTEHKIVFSDIGDAFARGGNRVCFVDPRDASRCIKVLRADRLPEKKRQLKTFPKNLKPLARFDDNLEEVREYHRIASTIGEDAFTLIPRLHGMVDTNLGPGLCMDLVRDDDGRIAITLKQYLWMHGRDPGIDLVIGEFAERWQHLGMPSRNLLLHNIVVRCLNCRPEKLVVIDGLGWPDLVPIAYYFPALARKKSARKLRSMDQAIIRLLIKREHNADYGYHGWLEEQHRLA